MREKLLGFGVIEIFVLLRRAAPSPQKHLFRDNLMAALALFDHIAASEE